MGSGVEETGDALSIQLAVIVPPRPSQLSAVVILAVAPEQAPEPVKVVPVVVEKVAVYTVYPVPVDPV